MSNNRVDMTASDNGQSLQKEAKIKRRHLRKTKTAILAFALLFTFLSAFIGDIPGLLSQGAGLLLFCVLAAIDRKL